MDHEKKPILNKSIKYIVLINSPSPYIVIQLRNISYIISYIISDTNIILILFNSDVKY